VNGAKALVSAGLVEPLVEHEGSKETDRDWPTAGRSSRVPLQRIPFPSALQDITEVGKISRAVERELLWTWMFQGSVHECVIRGIKQSDAIRSDNSVAVASATPGADNLLRLCLPPLRACGCCLTNGKGTFCWHDRHSQCTHPAVACG